MSWVTYSSPFAFIFRCWIPGLSLKTFPQSHHFHFPQCPIFSTTPAIRPRHLGASEKTNLADLLLINRRHVFRDLRPYVCAFEHCPNAAKLYVTHNDWPITNFRFTAASSSATSVTRPAPTRAACAGISGIITTARPCSSPNCRLFWIYATTKPAIQMRMLVSYAEVNSRCQSYRYISPHIWKKLHSSQNYRCGGARRRRISCVWRGCQGHFCRVVRRKRGNSESRYIRIQLRNTSATRLTFYTHSTK